MERADPSGTTSAKSGSTTPSAAEVAERPSPLQRLAASLWFKVPLALAFFRQLWPFLFLVATLSPSGYQAPSMLLSALQRPLLLAYLLAAAALFTWRRKQTSWAAIDPGKRTRVFVLVTAGVFAWAYSTYGYNNFYDQPHLADRLALLVLWALIVVHPGFVVSFTTALVVVMRQIAYPLPEAHWDLVDKRLPLDALILFVAFLAVRAFSRRNRSFYPFLLLLLTGAHYAHAAINKMRLGPYPWSWLTENHLSNLAVSAYLNGGWLRNLDEEQIVGWARFLRHFDMPLAALTLLIEGSGILLLLSLPIAMIALVGFVLLHISITLTSGILFWKWMVFDLALLWYLWQLRRDRQGALDSAQAAETGHRLFTRAHYALFLVLVLLSPKIFYNVPFAWWDSKLVNFFRITGIAADGSRYELHPRYFAPYDVLLQQSRFYHLTRRRVLVGTYGVADSYQVVKALDAASPDDLAAIRSQLGVSRFDLQRSQNFAAFLRSYIAGRNERAAPSWIRRLAPPFHFQSMMPPNVYRHQAPLHSVEVDFEEYFFDGERIVQTANEPVLRFRVRK